MTAKELLDQEGSYAALSGDEYEIELLMIEFARYHVQQALETAADNSVKFSATKQTVINSYPLDLIK